MYSLRKDQSTQRGFTILLAALVASLMLTLGLSIVSIVRKSVSLSSITRDSQFAFYAADTGAECALFWEMRHDFASTTAPISPITCAGNSGIVVTPSVALNPPNPVPLPVTFSFQFEPNGDCTTVEVRKNTTNPRTLIIARGYNASCSQLTSGARSVQRSVQIKY